jgi:hypothetical protein
MYNEIGLSIVTMPLPSQSIKVSVGFMEIRDVKVRVEGILNFVKPLSMGYIHGVKTNIKRCLNFFIYIYIYIYIYKSHIWLNLPMVDHHVDNSITKFTPTPQKHCGI